MKILVSNDDGVFSPGIITLSRVLKEHGYSPSVVAPDRERSSVGHSITLTRPLRLWEIEGGGYPEGMKVYACEGTPSDCVVLGLEAVAPESEMVISGINRGPNLADDLTYSGTVSAAMEGHILGRPSIAVSLNSAQSDKVENYESAAESVATILEGFKNFPFPEGILLNVNVPNLPAGKIRGFRITKKGIRIYRDKVNPLKDPKGRSYYWISGQPDDVMDDGSDVKAVSEGYVSITPIHMDMTHYPSIEKLRRAGFEKDS
ncbi:MAG TPA: 5'/3'-nucleotidase SurE [Synergistales bacterium]|jgi:5'-nucleotidase|nr:5'/3'-nucleotidase SurE [Synergistales bacterium]HRV70769.1 5'/3'-nucleotidase SurE [Thermovirgaceae bacterium]